MRFGILIKMLNNIKLDYQERRIKQTMQMETSIFFHSDRLCQKNELINHTIFTIILSAPEKLQRRKYFFEPKALLLEQLGANGSKAHTCHHLTNPANLKLLMHH